MLWGQPLEDWETTGVRLMFAGFFLAVIGAVVAFGSSYILWKVGKVAQAPRELSVEQTASIAKAVAGFEGLKLF